MAPRLPNQHSSLGPIIGDTAAAEGHRRVAAKPQPPSSRPTSSSLPFTAAGKSAWEDDAEAEQVVLQNAAPNTSDLATKTANSVYNDANNGLGAGLGAGGMMGGGLMGGTNFGLGGGGMGAFGGGGMGGFGNGMMFGSPYSSFGMMGPPPAFGPLSGLNQFLFGVQSVIFSLGQAVQIIGMNTQAVQQLLEAATTMLDHALATWHEMQIMDAESRARETEEEKKRRRRLRALRWAMTLAVSYAGYKIIRYLFSFRRAARNLTYGGVGGGGGSLPTLAATGLYPPPNVPYNTPLPPPSDPYRGYGSQYGTPYLGGGYAPPPYASYGGPGSY